MPWNVFSSIALFLNTLFLWKPQNSLSASIVIWLVRITTFSLLFRSFVGPSVLRLLNNRLRVQSVSLRSIRGIYFRAGKGVLHVDRVGLSYHRPSGQNASRFSIMVEGLRLEIAQSEPKGSRKRSSESSKRSKFPQLSDLAPSPLAMHTWAGACFIYSALYSSVEPFVRPVVRTFIVAVLRIMIRALPALTQVLDLEIDSAVLSSMTIVGAEVIIHKAKLHTSVVFTQLDNSSNSGALPHPTQPRHKRFVSVVDMNTRLRNSFRRTWERAWGSTQVAASVSLSVQEVLGVALQPLLKEMHTSFQDGSNKHTFVVIPNIAFTASVRLDPSQKVERHGLETSLSSDAASLDIDVVQYILKQLKKHDEHNEQAESVPPSSPPLSPSLSRFTPGSPAMESPQSILERGSHSPGARRTSRFGWVSPMSPTSPIMEALSMRFRWKPKHHPIRRIRGSKYMTHLSTLKAVHVNLPSLTLIHRLAMDEDKHPQTFRANLQQIGLNITLSHPDRVPLHREQLGRTSAPSDPLTADVYTLGFSAHHVTLDRIGAGAVRDHLRILGLGPLNITILVSQWPSPWLQGPTFLSGDPNVQFLTARVSLGKIEMTERLEVVEQLLKRNQRSQRPEAAEGRPSLPAVLSPVPRISIGLHVEEVGIRLISSGLHRGTVPFALEARTDGFTASAETHFQMLPDSNFGRLLTDHDRPRLQMKIAVHAALQRTFVNVNRATEWSTDDPRASLGGSLYPGEPVMSLDTLQLTGDGHAFGEMADEPGGGVTIDVASTFLNLHCATDALSVELWQPDAVAALKAIAVSLKTDPPEHPVPPSPPSYLLDKLPVGISASFAVARLMVFITGPDLAPGDDLNISRGVASHMGISLHYCSLKDKHCDGLSDIRSRTQQRLLLSLPTELVATAAGSTSAAALTQSHQALVQVAVWDLALRDALSTRFVADDPYGVGDMSEDYRSQEYLRVEHISIGIAISGRRVNHVPFLRSMDDCAVSVAVSHVRGYFHLAHAYNLLLAAQALKNLAPAKNIPPPARGAPSTLAYNVHFELDRVQLSWEFPLKMKLFTRIFALSAQRPASGKLKLQWDQILLAVPLDVERDGTPRVEWMELARISNWSVDIRPDVHPVAISAQGDSARLHIPYDYVLADLILDINLTVKCMKHLTRMIPSGQFENPPAPEAEEAKSMPDLSIRIGCLCVEAADDQFETQLGLIWRTGYESARLRLEREEAFEAKAAAVRAANQQDPSTPNRELQSEFQFTPEHTVSVEDALNRLYSLHAGSWASGFRQARAQQVLQQKTEMQKSMGKVDPPDALDTDLITIITAPPAPPLIRLNFDALSLHITGPSFPSSNLPDFLFNEGGGLPRDTQYSLLIPMHLTFAVASLRATCREYPLPLLNIPASSQKEISGLEFDSDVVIAEEMGTAHSVEWIDCAIVKAHTGVHGAPPLCVAVPKTLNPVKSYANPIIRVRTDDVTDFAWGVSYGPITQDLMRVVDTLSHAPRDDSPPIGFWDKLRLVFHWRLKVFFENDVHFHMKGSHDPHGLHGMGAGFALCWQGSPQLFINQKNDQNELIQVSSDSTLVVIPNIEESYGESSTTGPKTESHGTSASNKKCLPRKVCAKFGSGSRFGVGVALERTCGPDCPNCTGGTFDRQCRFFDFRPHYEVTLETKPQKPVENTPQDSYNGFRSDFIHLSISLTSSLNKDSDKYSSIHLSPAVFAHFWSWWTLFDGKALPIRQGGRYKHKRPLSPKFGQHLATIKYRIEVPHLFLSHIYMDESRDAWTDGVTPFVGVKAMIGRFQADMHQRTQQSTITTPDGAEKILIHKPFYAVEVVMKDLELRALLAIFSEPLKQRVPLEPNFLESSYRKRENIPVTETNSPWVDADDFLDVEWVSSETPLLHLLPVVSCPRFTYFRRASANTSENRVERTKFGDENSHECLLGKEASVLQAQIDIVRNRITELRDRSANEAVPCASTRPERQFTTDTNYMISLLETYIQKLEEESRTVPSNEPQSYYMPSDSVSSKDWAEFDNVYQVHCPKLYLDNIVRDIMMQYYYCSRARRGVEYHMATRAVKFIRDQALTAIHNFEHENIEPDKHRGHATGVAQTATQAVRKILGGGDGGPSTSVESSSEPLFHTPDNRDPLKGWSKGVSLRKGHFCLLLKPQLILRSETSTESVCVLTAVQGNLQTYHIMDDVNADDPVSGKIMNRNFASLSGLQAFSPSVENKSQEGVVPLEVLVDLRGSSSLFDRLVPQTNATFHYDKFNRLRLRNEITSVARTSHDGNDQMHNHLQSQNDLVRFHVPRFTVSANDRHFQAISNIVTNLLLFSDAAHKTRAERLEKMLFSYDFTNLSSAADVVSKLQIRLRMAVETRRQAQSKLQGRGDTGQVEKLKIEAHILLLAEELDYVFEAIKLAQDKADGQAAQKSALLLHASSSEISWHMLDRHDQLLAKLAVRDIDFRWLNRQDSSTVNHLEVGNLQAFDGAADAEWTEILSKYDEPSNHPLVKRKLFCVADWTVLPPVGGITIYEAFELVFHPLRLQIDSRVGSRIMEYVWPTRRKRVSHRADSAAEVNEILPPPSQPSSPIAPRTPLPQTPRTPRRASADLPSPRSTDPGRLTVPALRKIGTSRSFSDIRKAATDSLQVQVPSLHRTKSTDVLLTLSASNSSGQISKASDGSNSTRLPSLRHEVDDAAVMKTRSSQKTFVWVKVSTLHLLLSIMKEDSFLCRDARIQTRDLEYRNQTWSFEELVDQFIPSGKNWKGWVKMAFSQPLVPVLPVARELISKTKWVNTKGHQSDIHRRGTASPRLPFIGPSREDSQVPTRKRTTSTLATVKNAPLYKTENFSSLGLTSEPEPLPPLPPEPDETGRRTGKRLFKVFKRRKSESKTRGSFESTESSSSQASSSWTRRNSAHDSHRPLFIHSNSDTAV